MKDASFITEKPIDLNALLARSHHPAAGALVLFSGEVRNHNEGRAVLRLEYEAHTLLAEKMMAAICQEARERWELNLADCVHRVGPVAIGESAVAVLTASAHRGEAYAANRYIIDRIKHEVPLWKKEFFADGTSEWSRGCQHETHESDAEHGTGDVHDTHAHHEAVKAAPAPATREA